MDKSYGLELTNNSKASWAFSLPRSATCIGATDLCKRVCYGNGVRYQTQGQKAKRQRNFRTVELLLAKGGADLLAENLLSLIDQAKPSDWIAAAATGTVTRTPWTVRIHDTGDFHSVPYVQAWHLAAKQRPLCSVWFYTRSFFDTRIFDAMTELAALPNCQGWLSIDSENFSSGLLRFTQHPQIWKLSLLQEAEEELSEHVLPALAKSAKAKTVVSFPVHRGRHHAAPIQHNALFTCPAVIGVYKLEPDARNMRPCQSCTFCLPSVRTESMEVKA